VSIGGRRDQPVCLSVTGSSADAQQAGYRFSSLFTPQDNKIKTMAGIEKQ